MTYKPKIPFRMQARVDAVLLIRSWENDTSPTNYSPLKKILGYPSTMSDVDFANKMTDEDCSKLELLKGPHGYVIYKAMKARKC